MERLRVKIVLDAEAERAREELASKLKNDKAIITFLAHNNLSSGFVDKYVGMFADYHTVCQTCEKCKGISSCTFDVAGEYRTLVFEDDKLSFEMRKCFYLVDRDNRLAHLKQYLFNHLRSEFYEASLFTMNIEDERADYLKICNDLITWLDKKDKKGIYFYGGFGVGKTYLAACISNEFAKRKKTIAFLNSSEFCNEMRLNWNNSDFLQQTITVLKNVDVLVIDDIGAEVVTNWIRDELLFPILDGRMGNKMLTLFTSNYNYDELLKHFMYNSKGEKDEINAMRLMERISTLTDLLAMNGTNRRV